MAIRTTEKLITKDNGSSNEVVCPKCAKAVCMRLFESTDYSLAASFIGKDRNTYFAVCPECAAVFGVNENYIEEKQKGTACFMTESDLKDLGGKKSLK